MSNVLVVGLASEPDVHLGELARAFDLSSETVRLLRKLYADEGLEALREFLYRGAKADRRAALEKKARRLIEAGRSINEVHAALNAKVGRSTVARIRRYWAARRRRW